jgi:hypothetical protein
MIKKIAPLIVVSCGLIALMLIITKTGEFNDERIYLANFIQIGASVFIILLGVLMYQGKRESVAQSLMLSIVISTSFYLISPAICFSNIARSALIFISLICGISIILIGEKINLNFEKALIVLVWLVGLFAIITNLNNVFLDAIIIEGSLLANLDKFYDCLPQEYAILLLAQCAVIFTIIKYFISSK